MNDTNENSNKLNNEYLFYDEDDFFDADDWLYDDSEDFLTD